MCDSKILNRCILCLRHIYAALPYRDGFSISKGFCSDPKEAWNSWPQTRKINISFWEIGRVLWEVPGSSQDSSERYDLTFSVWEGGRRCASWWGEGRTGSPAGQVPRPPVAASPLRVSLWFSDSTVWGGSALPRFRPVLHLGEPFLGRVAQVLFMSFGSGPLSGCWLWISL